MSPNLAADTLPVPQREQSISEVQSISIQRHQIKHMRTVGSANIGQCINNILRRLMIDELAMKFSYTGRASNGNTKTPFHGSEISKCILIAVQTFLGTLQLK
ncbi:uncharacterized protein LOC120353093 [Nilaparvata lugens]|uniref:uncharacterized protein LOC120353093 n=1 Tax=Nilaparvata lugens TaxID=108931 RepID=UPI00193E15AC|nr:uncharacterized protein LOC120353093 [Nilaparvata lugens]